MWKSVAVILIAISFAVSGCDNSTYQHLTPQQVRNKADKMGLEDAYNFYIASYNATAPHMRAAAGTFARFGPKGESYLLGKALSSEDKNEFEAILIAIGFSDFRCSAQTFEKIEEKGTALGVDRIYLTNGCSSASM